MHYTDTSVVQFIFSKIQVFSYINRKNYIHSRIIKSTTRIEHKLSHCKISCYFVLRQNCIFDSTLPLTYSSRGWQTEKKRCILGNIAYLGIPRISVSHKPLIVRRRDIFRHVKRLVKEFEIRHVMTNVDLTGLYVFMIFMGR